MPIKYSSVVPWGRSYHEYIKMFDLSEPLLNSRILGCGDGPASFNTTMTKLGRKIVSIDPIYQFSHDEIQQRINETFHIVMEQTIRNRDYFIWNKIKGPEHLGKIRMDSMKEFLNDYESGIQEGRYIYAELPDLPFKNNQFDLALSSHFLFLYTDNLSYEFHLSSINEMLRVANEIRIFPLLDVNVKRSSYVDMIYNHYSNKGKTVIEKKVDYEFQKGGNSMLIIS